MQNAISITNPSYPDPYGGLSPQAFVTVSARPNISILDDNITNASGDTVTAGISRQLRPEPRASRRRRVHEPAGAFADAEHQSGRSGVRLQDADGGAGGDDQPRSPPRRSTPGGRWPTGATSPQLASNGWSDYRALYVRLDKRFANNYQYLLSYTRDWTRTTSATSPTTTTRTSRRGRPAASTRSWRAATRGFRSTSRLGAVWTIRTALPFDALSGVDLTGDGDDRSRAGRHAEHGGPRQRGDRAAARARQRVAGGPAAGADSGGPDREQRLQPRRPAS